MTKRTAKLRTKSGKKLSRSLLENMIRDLDDRLRKLREEAGAFDTIIKPNDQHTVIEHQTRMACSVMLDSLMRRIRDAESLARLLVHSEAST
jgi:hypothetical protein